MIKNINCNSIIITVSQMHVSLSLWSSLPYISIPYLRRLSIHSCCKFIMSIVAHHHHHRFDIEDIPDICHLFYTHALWDFKNFHSKGHKTTTKLPKIVCFAFIWIFLHSVEKLTNIRYDWGLAAKMTMKSTQQERSPHSLSHSVLTFSPSQGDWRDGGVGEGGGSESSSYSFASEMFV